MKEGTLIFSGDNVYTGGTTVGAAPTLQIGGSAGTTTRSVASGDITRLQALIDLI